MSVYFPGLQDYEWVVGSQGSSARALQDSIIAALSDFQNQVVIEATARKAADLLSQSAAPDALIATLTAFDDSTGVATAGTVRWPDGATGTYAATTDDFGVAGYALTHAYAGVTTTYTQPAVTRNNDGAVTVRPAIVVT